MLGITCKLEGIRMAEQLLPRCDEEEGEDGNRNSDEEIPDVCGR